MRRHGESEDLGETVPWKKALENIVAAVGSESKLSLNGVPGLKQREFPAGKLAETVGLVMKQVENPQ